MSKLSQNTLMPIGVAVIVIGGGAAWMTKINYAVDAATVRFEESKVSEGERYRELTDLLRQIDRRLSSIEGEMKRVRK